MEAINKYIKKNAKRFESEFFEFLRIPSVSTVPAHAKDMQKAAEWLAGLLAKIGFKPELVKTDRHPLIYAETP
ncbi:MAG: hypothetical protein FWC50_04970, partial [Planctomycetaceae bacterium]|nr:hypothetical protein [Planctomycetaceae bacterium]